MRNTMLAAMVIAAFAAGAAEPANDWENTAVNSRNRLPARTYSMPLADEAAAFTDALEPETPYRMSLDGMWKFRWTGDPARRPADFWKTDFDDSKWGSIDVPSCVEMRGYGVPQYTNIRYPFKMEPPRILDRATGRADYNPVSSYRRTFAIPESWAGRDVILRFDGVYSAYYVWVNGEKVGYAEDSKLPSEFNVTRFLRPAGEENVIAVESYRWCDGSYLEDQDMFRFGGIFRDVTLWAMPKGGIWDFEVRTALKNDYRDATIALAGLSGDWSAKLYDAARRPVATLAAAAPSAEIRGVRTWSAEKPELYTLVVRKGADIRTRKVGFKEVRIEGNAILVNGRKIKFKGVNRHETNPENGRTVSMDDMLKDVTLFKRYNINTVRTSHYPDHHSWYDLCDRYGIYVVAEANVEGHEAGFGDDGLGKRPEFDAPIVERNARHVEFYRNHPSVALWSLGNETGHGDCFVHARDAVRARDAQRRPIHWEPGNRIADVDSTMYPEVDWLERRGKLGDMTEGDLASSSGGDGWAKSNHTAGKAFFLCEYAHAMGNAIGNFQEYWDVFYRYDALAGGCIWDWVDQAVWKQTDRVDERSGRRERYLAYGGDYDDDPNDGPFCCNGVVDPLRNVSPKLLEVAHVHRNLVVTNGADTGTYGLWNRFGFTRADEFAGSWRVIADGVEVAKGVFDVPPVEPLARGEFKIAELARLPKDLDGRKEHFVEFAFATKAATRWADAGWVVARDQLPFRVDPFDPEAAAEEDEPDVSRPIFVEERGGFVTVEIARTTAVFSRETGTLSSLIMRGVPVMLDPARGIAGGPQLTCVRAFTDNDIWMRQGAPWTIDRAKGVEYSGLTQLSYHPEPLVIGTNNTVTSVIDVAGAHGCGFRHVTVWTFASDGSIVLENEVEPYGTFPRAIPRLGLSMRLPQRLEFMRWYGRGPGENYVDRCTASFFGVWNSTVTDQYVDYVRPQDCGSKCDVRWIEFTNRLGQGVRFSSREPFFAQALHYTWNDLDSARHRNGQIRRWSPSEKRPEICLNLDVRQTGLGGASCGPAPMAKYRFNPQEKVAWKLKIEPVIAAAGKKSK